LKALLDGCTEDGVEPRKHFSGKFSLRVAPAMHEAAAEHGQSLNQWAADALRQAALAESNPYPLTLLVQGRSRNRDLPITRWLFIGDSLPGSANYNRI